MHGLIFIACVGPLKLHICLERKKKYGWSSISFCERLGKKTTHGFQKLYSTHTYAKVRYLGRFMDLSVDLRKPCPESFALK